MKDYENIRDALKELLEITDPTNEYGTVKTYSDSIPPKLIGTHEMTPHDLAESAYEIVVSIADLLGMEDLYLENNVERKSKTK